MTQKSMFFVGDFGVSNTNTLTLDDELKSIIRSSAYACVNFEGCLHEGGIESPNRKPVPQSNESPEWLINNGFNIINLANNHLMDYGVRGLEATINAFNTNFILIGAGSWQDAYKLSVVQLSNTKIGLLAGTSSDFSSLKNIWDDAEKKGAANLFTRYFSQLILTAKERCDILIVLAHAGLENFDYPIPEIREKYYELIDFGADMVIASHPHCPQGFEEYKGKTIFYSLGNFCFDGSYLNKSVHPPYWNFGYGVKIWVDENQKLSWTTVPILRQLNELKVATDKNLLSHLNHLNDVLKDHTLYRQLVETQVLKTGEIIKNYLLNGFNAAPIKISFSGLKRIINLMFQNKFNYKVSLHQIREESSVAMLKRYLKNNTKSYL